MVIWLRTNVRALWAAMLPPMVIGAVGWFIAADAGGRGMSIGARVLGALVGAGALVAIMGMSRQLGHPRLGLEDGHLLVHLRAGSPRRVPLEVVEGFLLGQGPSLIGSGRLGRMETANLVIRLAESASEWARADVHPSLGSWCNHYVTIRGTWCEPLDLKLVQKLNARLAAAKSRPREEQPTA